MRLLADKFRPVAAILLIAAVMFAAGAHAVPPGTDAEIEARIKPAGNLCRTGDDCGTAAAAVASGPLSGDQVYSQFCFACHAAGVSGAPKLGSADDWSPRIAKGMDALMNSTLNGLNAMPAKGTCMSCSDDELKAAVDHMLGSVN